MPRTFIYLTRELPGISEEMSQAGFQVYEALAVSEVFYLAKQHPGATIIADHEPLGDGRVENVARFYH